MACVMVVVCVKEKERNEKITLAPVSNVKKMVQMCICEPGENFQNYTTRAVDFLSDYTDLHGAI